MRSSSHEEGRRAKCNARSAPFEPPRGLRNRSQHVRIQTIAVARHGRRRSHSFDRRFRYAVDRTRSPRRRHRCTPGEDEPPASPNAKSPAKVRLEENQKDIKKDVEKLFDLASQLKQQVEKTDATAVLSLAMVKKAEEIERLARQIK